MLSSFGGKSESFQPSGRASQELGLGMPQIPMSPLLFHGWIVVLWQLTVALSRTALIRLETHFPLLPHLHVRDVHAGLLIEIDGTWRTGFFLFLEETQRFTFTPTNVVDDFRSFGTGFFHLLRALLEDTTHGGLLRPNLRILLPQRPFACGDVRRPLGLQTAQRRVGGTGENGPLLFLLVIRHEEPIFRAHESGTAIEVHWLLNIISIQFSLRAIRDGVDKFPNVSSSQLFVFGEDPFQKFINLKFSIAAGICLAQQIIDGFITPRTVQSFQDFGKLFSTDRPGLVEVEAPKSSPNCITISHHHRREDGFLEKTRLGPNS